MTTSDDDERSFLGDEAFSASAGTRVQIFGYWSSSSFGVVLRAKRVLGYLLFWVSCCATVKVLDLSQKIKKAINGILVP